MGVPNIYGVLGVPRIYRVLGVPRIYRVQGVPRTYGVLEGSHMFRSTGGSNGRCVNMTNQLLLLPSLRTG